MLGEMATTALGFGAAVGSAGASYFGQHKANKDTRRMVKDQMSFQERMSNTAHQRQMEDMRQAGLNPILSARYGGSSTPSGASAAMQDELGPVVSSALDAKRSIAELQNIHAQNAKIRADTDLTRTMKDVALEDIGVKNLTAKQMSTRLPGMRIEQALDESIIGGFKRVFGRLNSIYQWFTGGK